MARGGRSVPARLVFPQDVGGVERRRIPGTELEVSAVGLGCWALGGEHWGDDVDPEEGKAAVRAALEAGVTLFDTAPLYGAGRADRLLREALGPHLREVVVATKVGARMEGAHAISDLSPAHVRADVEASLRRLGVERLDLLQAHWPCERGTPLADTMEALVRLREEGKVRHLGLCNHGPEAIEAWADALAVAQTPLSLIRREGLSDVVPAARRGGVGVLAYEPLARGLLSGKFRALPRFPESDMRRRDPRFWASRFGQLAPSVGPRSQVRPASQVLPAPQLEPGPPTGGQKRSVHAQRPPAQVQVLQPSSRVSPSAHSAGVVSHAQPQLTPSQVGRPTQSGWIHELPGRSQSATTSHAPRARHAPPVPQKSPSAQSASAAQASPSPPGAAGTQPLTHDRG